MDQEKNALLNLVNHQPDIDTIHQCAKDPCEAKHDDKKYIFLMELHHVYIVQTLK